MTQDEFIQKMNIRYGNKFDFSETVYVNNTTKIHVTCNRCGADIYTRPGDLYVHGTCRKCTQYHDKAYYVEKFIDAHGDKYDYSCMSKEKLYTRHDTITIICPIHGEFQQKIKNHINGNGCKLCGYNKSGDSVKISLEDIKKRLDKLCGSDLEYDIKKYKNTNTPLPLKCNKCGKTFMRDVNALMINNTCPYCNGKNRNLTYKTNEFIEKARNIHGDKYDYSKTVYKKTDEKICVICHKINDFGDEHGEFWVTPHSHIGVSKTGCPKCSGKHQKTTEEFIKEAKIVQDNFYDYSEVKYINAKTKVKIICPVHGEFWQTPNSHLMGQGCPICKQSVYERKINKFLKENNIEYIPQYKPSFLRPLSLDFYLPKYDLGIEVQGYQHFHPVKYWGGDKNFEYTKNRDDKKRLLCEKHGIKVLYYSELKMDYPYEVITNPQKLLEVIQNSPIFANEN